MVSSSSSSSRKFENQQLGVKDKKGAGTVREQEELKVKEKKHITGTRTKKIQSVPFLTFIAAKNIEFLSY